jgi:signal transduction histidine kinase/DNA-binding response OmpR family regulator/ligand-binding sensor domain-containing protein
LNNSARKTSLANASVKGWLYAKNDFSLNKVREGTDLQISDSTRTGEVNYFVEQLDNTKGLSNSSVNTIFQDSENLIWIGTFDGLNRYDGNEFKIFRPELKNENSLSNQVIRKIGEDQSGLIWVLTTGGIDSYNKKTNTFKRHYFNQKNKFTLSEGEYNFAIDNSEQVFCAVRNWGFGYFDGEKFQKIGVGNFPLSNVRAMEFGPSGELFLLFNNDEFYSLKIQTDDVGRKAVSNVKKIAERVQKFSILENNIAYVMITGNTVLYNSINFESRFLDAKNIQNIISLSSQEAVLYSPNGNFVLNSTGELISHSWLKFLKNKKITAFLRGTENVIWAGSDGDAILKIYPHKKSFNLISPKQVPEMEGAIVRAFAEVKEKGFFVATKGEGLFQFPPKFYISKSRPLKYKNYNELNSSINNSVYALCDGQDDLLFIGTDGDGISFLDLKTSRLISWNEVIGHEQCSYFKSTYTIYQDDDGYIWCGTSGYGMVRFKIKRTHNGLEVVQFKNYLAKKEENGFLSSNIIYSIVPRNKNELWIGTRLGGLNLFQKNTALFKAYMNNAMDLNSISNNDILCLYLDVHSRLWIGTSFGLDLVQDPGGNLNDKNLEFKNFTINEGLPNNTIHGVVYGEDSSLWVSTNYGLSNFIVNDSKFINYTKNEGLQNNEYADGAYFKAKEAGYIFMGGIKGFNYFQPSKVEESISIPDIFIDKISGQNEEKPFFQSLVISPNSRASNSIDLEHNQNFLDIEMSALTYINSEKCQYAYRLSDFDQDWNFINNRRNISFTNIPPGMYTLWIKWTNSDGVWSDEVKAVNIKISPAFWRSSVAYLLYGILFTCFLLFVFSYYKKQQSLKQTIIFRKRDEKIHQNRLTFFTNIAHEFQTPLTLIVGPIQKLSESIRLTDPNQHFVKLIERNSSRLLYLTQQLLEFRKAEYGHLGVTLSQFDLVGLIEQIVELFDEVALNKKIEYNIDIPTELIAWYDKDKVEKIIFNLLSNAFKYTPEYGKIKLQCSILNNRDDFLEIVVTNSGKGISKDKIDSLFNRFFLVEDNNDELDANMSRTGIGLAYVKKLVNVLNGNIQVSSKLKKETTFSVSVPCSKEVYSDYSYGITDTNILVSKHLKNILEKSESNGEYIPDKIFSIENQIDDRKTVMIVEDDKEIQFFIRELLNGSYKTLLADNGVAALSLMKTETPDLIITDVMMPKMNGVEFCKKIKSSNETCHIPVIMLTAKSDVLHRIEGLENGANDYISKPFYPDHVLVKIKKLLEEKEVLLNYLKQDTFIDNITNLPVVDEEKEFIKKLIELIQSNIENENLQSLFLEKQLGMSKSQLYRKIKQLFNLSPGDLIRTLRLKHAASLLRSNDLTVSQIYYQSGFNNRSYFYREFKKMFHVTPKSYQLKHKSSKKTS